ncbi:dihydrofolate reductase family protein [Stackebrandtia nassauensis]|uniref:Bifunctional deaminase-reductase domain protein n=1 Tax=Stackebrandtia nassauensis (strain DSM 44728 / CIP 108903 / NRRL B-16338 / NBRC 102104 / LLR-40K-21) TaxID=446470 RepID=D3PUX5_STANL|nr:dihydrofolate reductase family protein [Stackebrandtia nassauensis]ADD44999.1 bifunctional deaminase-reductase domain protein [Stackebrandtia nassauensis DSM 44728]
MTTDQSSPGKVFAQASVSLDGYIAGPGNSGFDRLFAWCTAGDVETPSADPERLTYRTSEATARYLRDLMDHTGALVVGRKQFDMTNGWGGAHPQGDVPVFVVTHNPPEWTNTVTPFTFVTDGVESAVRQAIKVADGKDVGIGPGSIVGQALSVGLLDELRIDLVPTVLGGGVRMLDGVGAAPIDLSGPETITGVGVTHLIYRRPTS